jgi:rhodanese-related sulfurtransferase
MKEVSAQEAYRLLEKDPDCIYLDVRSIPEFEAGHPLRAINIPILHFVEGMGMSPNEDFVKVVEANVPKDAKILVGCKTGMRSAHACEVLSQLGYQDTTNVRPGFVGSMDPFGRITEPGWSMLGLPLCSECVPESNYEALAAKAK